MEKGARYKPKYLEEKSFPQSQVANTHGLRYIATSVIETVYEDNTGRNQ